MNKKEAEDLMNQYNQHWGEGKSFDISVTNRINNAAELLTMLHRPESMSDEEKLSVINSLRFDSLYMKAHQETKDRFLTTSRIVLEALLDSIVRHDEWEARHIVEQMLMPILSSGGVTETMDINIKAILSMMNERN
ncbi:hypothetical protein VPHD295_0078 [Vibrio phage D295]